MLDWERTLTTTQFILILNNQIQAKQLSSRAQTLLRKVFFTLAEIKNLSFFILFTFPFNKILYYKKKFVVLDSQMSDMRISL